MIQLRNVYKKYKDNYDEIEQMLTIFEKVVIEVDKEVKEGKFGK